ncbi:MAG: YlmC/YmxH family sporulation protein [Lachnospiraceae bacterium]
MNLCELRQKEVINMNDCKRLGYVADVEFDLKSGKIIAIIVPGCAKVWGFLGRDTEYWIAFDKICHIGPDIILVDIKEEECIRKCSFDAK